MADENGTPHVRRIVVEFNDTGGLQLDIDPRLGISELASVAMMLGHQVDRILDQQVQAMQRQPSIIRAASVPTELSKPQ